MSDAEPGRSGVFPVSERRIEQGFYLVVFAWVGTLMAVSLDLDYSAKLVPMLVGVPVLALTLLKLLPVDWNAYLDRHLSGGTDEDLGEDNRMTDRWDDEDGNGRAREQRVALEMIGWCVGLVALIHLFGYYYTLPPYVFALAWYLKRSVRSAAVVTVIFVSIVMLLFVLLFEQQLYTGVFDLGMPFL